MESLNRVSSILMMKQSSSSINRTRRWYLGLQKATPRSPMFDPILSPAFLSLWEYAVDILRYAGALQWIPKRDRAEPFSSNKFLKRMLTNAAARILNDATLF